MSRPLNAIDLYLDDPRDCINVGIYKEMSVSEVERLICSTFQIDNRINVVGVHQIDDQDKEEQNPIIPLSYLTHNPNSIDQESKYQIVTSIGRFKPKSKNYRYWIKILLGVFCISLVMYLLPDYTLAHRPILRNIYLNGPNYKIPVLSADIGFWSGKEMTVICSEISGQSSEFWSKNIIECTRLIQTKIKGFIILIETVIGIYLGFLSIKLLMRLLINKLFKS